MKLEHTDTTRLFMYCLYERPRDYPNHYVLIKRFQVHNAAMVAWLDDPKGVFIEPSVEVIHTIMQRNGFAWLVRNPEDDPVIMGVYI